MSVGSKEWKTRLTSLSFPLWFPSVQLLHPRLFALRRKSFLDLTGFHASCEFPACFSRLSEPRAELSDEHSPHLQSRQLHWRLDSRQLHLLRQSLNPLSKSLEEGHQKSRFSSQLWHSFRCRVKWRRFLFHQGNQNQGNQGIKIKAIRESKS